MSNETISAKTVLMMQKEAKRLHQEFESYLEDLEMFSKPEFWQAVRESQQGKVKKFSSVKKLLNELDN